MSEETRLTTPTTRFSIYIIASTTLLGAGIVGGSRELLLTGVSMALYAVVLRGYLELAVSVVSRLEVEVSRRGSIERRDIEVVFRIRNRSYVPVFFIELSLDHSPHLARVSVGRALVFVPARSVVEFRVVFRGRTGTHRIGPLRAVVRDPLGLFRSGEIVLRDVFYVRVYPEVQDIVMRRIYSYARGVGLSRSREAGEGIEFRSVREYRPGDDMRRIVWKTYARTGRLYVKEMERETSIKILYLVLSSEEMFRGVYHYTPYEQIARVVGSVARYIGGRSDEQAVVVATPSGVFYTERFGRGLRGYIEVVRRLSMTDLERVFGGGGVYREAVERVSALLDRERVLALVFIDTVTASIPEFEEVLKRLRAGGHHVIVFMPMRSLYDVKALSGPSALIYRIKVLRETEREKEILRRLRARGLETVALTPEQMILHIVSRVEALRY